MLTQSFAEAVAEAEQIITGAPHIQTEADLAEGYDYLAGNIRGSLQLAWAYQRDFPYFVSSTGPYTKLGLDNPDALYFHSYLRDDAEYVVTGRRGSTTDLSFQVLNGDYSPVEVPDSLSAFDDREIEIAGDGTFELRFGPAAADSRAATTSRSARARRCSWSARCTATGTPSGAAPSASTAPTAPGSAPPVPDAAAMAKRYTRGGQDPAVPAADLPRLPRVVLPDAAGQHADRAAPTPGRPGHPVLLGRPLRARRRPGDDRDRPAPRPGTSRRTRASSSAACGTSRSTTSTTRPASPPTRRAPTRTAGCAS